MTAVWTNVASLQRLLVRAGYAITIDGLFGPETAGAVARYAQAKGIGATDIPRIALSLDADSRIRGDVDRPIVGWELYDVAADLRPAPSAPGVVVAADIFPKLPPWAPWAAGAAALGLVMFLSTQTPRKRRRRR